MKKITKIKHIDAIEGKWYLITEGHFIHVCCGCGLEHEIQVGLAWKEEFEELAKNKVSIRFLRTSDDSDNKK